MTQQTLPVSYYLYTAHTHVCMNCGADMRPRNSDEENQVHNNNKSGNHKSMHTQQDNAGVNNANML